MWHPACFFVGNDILAVGQVFKLAGSLRRGLCLQACKGSIQNSNLTVQNSNLTVQNSNLTFQNGNLTFQNVNLLFQNSNLAFQNSNLTVQNSNLAFQNSNLAFQNSNLAFKRECSGVFTELCQVQNLAQIIREYLCFDLIRLSRAAVIMHAVANRKAALRLRQAWHLIYQHMVSCR